MAPEPRDETRDYEGRDLLKGRKALITGGDSGIGRAVAIAFAKEGADVAIAYLTEHEDAEHTRKLVEQQGRRCALLPGDLGQAAHCADVVDQTFRYAATRGAINAFTQSMAQNLVDKRIGVSAVAPGPVWTPLIPATFPEEKVEEFGKQVPRKRAADPDEIAPSSVFFAAGRLSSSYTGEVLAPIGGETLPG